MKLTSVSGHNFRSYSEINWVLPQSGLHLIDGKNLDSGRNNMTGKTTLLDSVFWALYGYLPKWGGPKGAPADAVIKRGEKKTDVTVEIEHAGKKIVITRERPLKLQVWVDDVELKGKAGDLDAMIPGLVGMNDEQFLISVYISQKRKTSFFKMSDTDRANLLSTIAGLHAMDRALEKAKAKKSDLEKQIEKQNGIVETLEQDMASAPGEIESLKLTLLEHQKELAQAEQALAQVTAQVEAEEAELRPKLEYQLELAEITYSTNRAAILERVKALVSVKENLEAELKQSPQVEVEITQAIFQLKYDIQAGEKFNQEQDKIAQQNQRYQDQVARELDLMDQAQAGKCSHCKQDLPSNDKEAAAANHLKRAQDLGALIKEVQPKVDLEPLREQLDQANARYAVRKNELDQKPAQIREQIKTMTEQVNQARIQLDQETRTHSMNTQMLEGQIKAAKAKAEASILQAKTVLQSIERLVQQADNNLKRGLEAQAGLQEKLEQNKLKVLTLSRELDQVLDLIDIFGPKGFRSIAFEGLISRISDRAGELFSIMTDGIYSTRIDQVGETAKGEAKLILKPVITRGGLDVPSDDLSGGAEATASLAYDVAVSEAVGDSSALFLDEALDGLDAQGKAEALRLLEEVAATRAVVMVDHTSEIRSAIPNVIQVTYQGETSRLS